MEWNDQKACDPIELRIYSGADGSFTLYEDAGDGYGYEKGEFSTIPITWNEKERKLTIGERRGEFPGMPKNHTFRIVLVAPGQGIGMGETKEAKIISYSGSRAFMDLYSSTQVKVSGR